MSSYNSYSFNKSVLFNLNHDYIVHLPSTMPDYMAGLGRSTRKNIQNNKSKFTKNYPRANFVSKCGREIEKGIIDRIIQLNTSRMIHKGIIPGKNAEEKNNIYKYSQHYGVVTYIEIDGEIVAGNIAYILNKRMFGCVIAHDENFSKYDVGKLCQLFLIQISIEKGLSAFHFLWGDNDYKQRFLGKPHSLGSYFLYKDYSLDYLLTKVKTILLRILLKTRQSEIFKPIRDAVKTYRKNIWKKQLDAGAIDYNANLN